MLNRNSGLDRDPGDPQRRAPVSTTGARRLPSSPEPTHPSRRFSVAVRDLLHIRYLRAAIAGLACCTILITGLACALEFRHGVSHRAVYRLLTRKHFEQADLSRLLQRPETAQQLADMVLDAQAGLTVGGLIHIDESSLRFDRHRRDRDDLARLDLEANQELYPSLTTAYFENDLNALLTQLESSEVRRRLEREGVSSLTVPRLRWRSRGARDPIEIRRLIREAGRLIHMFFPLQPDGYSLSLGEKLRFYEERNPAGEFVGIFEVVNTRLGGNLNAQYARELAGRAHYLAIEPQGDGRVEIHDFFMGVRVGVYRMRSVAHPANFPLFHVERVEPGGDSRHDLA